MQLERELRSLASYLPQPLVEVYRSLGMTRDLYPWQVRIVLHCAVATCVTCNPVHCTPGRCTMCYIVLLQSVFPAAHYTVPLAGAATHFVAGQHNNNRQPEACSAER